MGNEKEIAIIPKGTYVSIMGCRITLAEDTKVEGNQADLDYILKEQENFNKGIGIVGGTGVDVIDCQPNKDLAQGAVSAMHVSANIGTQSNSHCWEQYSNIDSDKQLDISMQNAIREAAKALNFANNARFINIVEWRTNMIERLLSHISIKTIDEAISECQKLENHIFGEKEPCAPKDWRLL